MSTIPQPAAARLLDGRRFDGVVLESGQTVGDAESITFEGGRFRSSACDAYGYGDGAYVARRTGSGIEFECETESPTYGQLRWHGVVEGARMNATLKMIRDGAPCGEKWILAGQV